MRLLMLAGILAAAAFLYLALAVCRPPENAGMVWGNVCVAQAFTVLALWAAWPVQKR